MATTVVGLFGSQKQADEALHALRSQLSDQNVAIIVRSESARTSQGHQASATDYFNNLTDTAMNLTASAGELLGRTIAFTARAGFTLPMRMMAPMMQGLTGNLSNSKLSGTARDCSGMSTGMGMGMGMGMGSRMQTQSQGMCSGSNSTGNSRQEERVEITLQGEGNLLASVDIMREHGAKQVNTYSA